MLLQVKEAIFRLKELHKGRTFRWPMVKMVSD